jgi:hypothetical protein
VISPTTSPVTLADGNTYVQGFNYTNAQVNDSIRSDPCSNRQWDMIGTADRQDGQWPSPARW